MKVYMRHEDDGDGYEIGEVPLVGLIGHLEALAESMKNGVHCSDGEDITDASFQIAYDAKGGGAYAEIVLHSQEEAKP